MLRTPDGRPRCAIVTTAHLERRRAAVRHHARAVEARHVDAPPERHHRPARPAVHGRGRRLPAADGDAADEEADHDADEAGACVRRRRRARTQNPVDIDYKALSNAGTWMIGRLQTERDKQRLLDGMSAAAGGVDVGAVGDTISGLAKREFVLRRAGKDKPEVFTTRWAMSYLRGPLTRDQIATADGRAEGRASAATGAARQQLRPGRPRRCRRRPERPSPSPPQRLAADDPTTRRDARSCPRWPTASPVRWVDVAAPWLAAVGGDPRAARMAGRRGRTRRAALRRRQGGPRPRRGVRGACSTRSASWSTSAAPSPSTTTIATCAPTRRPTATYRARRLHRSRHKTFWTKVRARPRRPPRPVALAHPAGQPAS